LSPKVILDIASKAIEFWIYQKGTEQDYKLTKLTKNEQQIQQLEKVYQEKTLGKSK